jgi:hypothetical protein
VRFLVAAPSCLWRGGSFPIHTRRVWAERPIAHGHHRFDWLYITAFASPATGETFWYLSNGEFFEALLETFAREAEAGVARIILLVLAGREHSACQRWVQGTF